MATDRTLKVTEAMWQEQVIDLAELHSWRVMHVRRSKVRDDRWATATSIPGWPDLTIYRPAPDGTGELLFAELKIDGGSLSANQRQVTYDLTKAGQEVHVWRPKDFDTVYERLTRHRTTPLETSD